jgi:carboxylesterase type B
VLELFHRAISQSGTALSPWAHVRATAAREKAFKLGDLLGCKNKQLENTEQLIKCIRKKPAKELVDASTKILVSIQFKALILSLCSGLTVVELQSHSVSLSNCVVISE